MEIVRPPVVLSEQQEETMGPVGSMATLVLGGVTAHEMIQSAARWIDGVGTAHSAHEMLVCMGGSRVIIDAAPTKRVDQCLQNVQISTPYGNPTLLDVLGRIGVARVEETTVGVLRNELTTMQLHAQSDAKGAGFGLVFAGFTLVVGAGIHLLKTNKHSGNQQNI